MKLSHLSLAVFSAIALAACGGSSNDQTKHEEHKDEHHVPGDDSTTSTPSLSSDVFAALNNTAGNGVRVYNLNSQGRQLPDGAGTSGTSAAGGAQNAQSAANGTNIQVAAPNNGPLANGGVQLATLAAQNAYIKNEDLYNVSGNLDRFANGAGGPYVAAFAAGNSVRANDVYYKDGQGNFVLAWVARTSATAPIKYYKDDGSAAGAADTSAPLAANELYQDAQANLTTVTGYKAFDQTFARPGNSVNNYSAIDRSKIEIGKVTKSDVSANVQYSAQKIAPVNDAGAPRNRNFWQIDSDGNGIVIQDSKEFKVGEIKAYNLPHSLTTVSMNAANRLNANGYLVGNYQANGGGAAPNRSAVQVSGLRTLDLPQNVSATYTGKVFTPRSEADLSLDVTFGTTNSAYVKNVSITNRTESGTKQADLQGQSPVAINYSVGGGDVSTDSYVVTLVGSDGTTPAGVEYNRLGGKFYGPKAEETAGQVYRVGGANAGLKGGFAAQRGDLK